MKITQQVINRQEIQLGDKVKKEIAVITVITNNHKSYISVRLVQANYTSSEQEMRKRCGVEVTILIIGREYQ